MNYEKIVITKVSDFDYDINGKNEKCELLGWITRDAQGKEWVFEADYDMTFDSECLDEILHFIKSLEK